MTLNKAQFEQFVENYVSDIVAGLDVDQLATIAFDLLVREYETYTEEQIVNEIKEIYDEEYAQNLLESVDEVPVWLVAHWGSAGTLRPLIIDSYQTNRTDA